MPLDLNAEILAALSSPDGRKLLADAAEEGARRALAKQAEDLEPLAVILGCSLDAARMRLARDQELAALGLRVGRRLLFRRSDVTALLSARQAPRRGGTRHGTQ